MADTPSDNGDCPECVQGKHQNCDGKAWDHEEDELGDCFCALRGHLAPGGLVIDGLYIPPIGLVGIRNIGDVWKKPSMGEVSS